MADTGFVRFTSVTDTNGIWDDESNLTAGNTGNCTTTTNSNTYELVLSGLSLGIPAGSTINGIEYQFRADHDGGIGFEKYKALVRLNAEDSDSRQFTLAGTPSLFSDGGSTDLLGLTITDSDVDDLELVFSVGQNPTSVTFNLAGNTSDPSPAIKVYYTEPTPTPTPTGTGLSITSGKLSIISGKLSLT